jgi:YHS domain-containing protein
MKTSAIIAAIILAASLTLRAEDTNSAAGTQPTPDKLTTCPVSGDKLGGDMGGPYVFTYKGQEVKLCCKNCKKDFDKNPEKFISKIRAADGTDKN